MKVSPHSRMSYLLVPELWTTRSLFVPFTLGFSSSALPNFSFTSRLGAVRCSSISGSYVFGFIFPDFVYDTDTHSNKALSNFAGAGLLETSDTRKGADRSLSESKVSKGYPLLLSVC